MSDESSLQEKTHQPSEKKKKQSLDQGTILRSKELDTALLLIASSLVFFVFGPYIVNSLRQVMVNAFQFRYIDINENASTLEFIGSSFSSVVLSLLPLILIFVFVLLFSSILLGGLHFKMKLLAPQLKRLNPASGLKKIFSMNSLVELFKTVLKFTLVFSVGLSILYLTFNEIMFLSNEPTHLAIYHGTSLLQWTFLFLVLGLIFIAVIDVPIQYFQYNKKIMMSLQEVKDEAKESEGNPETKARVRRVQFEMTKKRMINEVPAATVIITNPTHYAVALRYEHGQSSAPIIVAKGTDLLAQKIREIAAQNNIEIISAPPLARAIYYSTKLFSEIPQGLYLACAQVLAYVYQLNQYKKGLTQKPSQPLYYDIPEEFKTK